MIAVALGAPNVGNSETARNRAANEKPKDAHPAGKRLRPDEQEAARENAPRIKSTGKALRWDYNPHAGCHNNACKHVRGKSDRRGAHWGVSAQLARRGGLSGAPIVLPEKVDGYLQDILGKNVASEPQGGNADSSFVNDGTEREPKGGEAPPSPPPQSEVSEVNMDTANRDGFAADDSIFVAKTTVPGELANASGAPDTPAPLQSCATEAIDFADAVGQVPCDFLLAECAEAEEPLGLFRIRMMIGPTRRYRPVTWVEPRDFCQN